MNKQDDDRMTHIAGKHAVNRRNSKDGWPAVVMRTDIRTQPSSDPQRTSLAARC
jgi:hypothetical protein